MNPFADDIAAALEMIAEDGEACVWSKPAASDPNAKPWRDKRIGEPTDYPVSIAFFSPADIKRGVGMAATFVVGTETVTATQVGIMAGGQDFDVEVTDTLLRTSGKAQIIGLDNIAPNGIAILWYVFIK